MNVLKNLIRSRKVAVAIVTIGVAAAQGLGLNVSPEIIEKIIWVGLALIAGITIEDSATKIANGKTTNGGH